MIIMFALLAAICFFLAAVGVTSLGPVSFVLLGACLLSLQFAFGTSIPWLRR